MKKNILSALAVCAVLFGCQKSYVQEPAQNGTVLRATIEDEASTKTLMDANNNILWSEGDQIVAFMKSSYGQKYQLVSSFAGKTYADFEPISSGNGGDTEWDHNVAYYPYSETVECLKSGENYALDVVLPSVQAYARESFGNGAMAMVAVSEDSNITFRNVLGGMKLQLRGTQKVASITLQGKNSEKLSGAATVTAYTDDTKPVITMASDASTSVVLDCGEGVQLNESTATEFILALPPVLFSNGFTVTVTDPEGYVQTIGTDKPNEVKRSSLLVMPEVAVEIIQVQPDNEIWYTATSQVTPQNLSGMISHEYNEHTGRGVIKCESAITKIPVNFFSNQPDVTSVTIPQSVATIGGSAFKGCSLTSFTIPENVTRVEYESLSCETLKEVTVNTRKFNYFSGDAFYRCYNLEQFTGPLASSDGRFLISSNTLLSVAHAGLAKIEIPENVTTIAQNACVSALSVSEIIIPGSVTSIKTSAFVYCPVLKEVTIENDCVVFEELPFNACGAMEKFYGPLAYADGKCLIKDEKLISTATCGLTMLCIPEDVSEITFHSVFGTTLRHVIFPASIRRITTPAFNLPSGVTLQFLSATPPSLDFFAGENLFSTDIRPDLKIYVPAASLNAYKNAEGWMNYADYIFSGDDGDYIDEYGVNHGPGVKIGETVWAPVNCGYHKTDFKYGKLYQWGRKYGQGYSGNLYDINAEKVGTDSDATTPTIEDGGISIVTGNQKSNENVFYKGLREYDYDWVDTYDDKLWNSGTESKPVKTDYDPCPAGWRVPTYTELSELSQNRSSRTSEEGQPGYWFSGASEYTDKVPQVFFPATGERSEYGTASSRGRSGSYWSSGSLNNLSSYLGIGSSGTVMSACSRAYGSSVRCVQVTDEVAEL